MQAQLSCPHKKPLLKMSKPGGGTWTSSLSACFARLMATGMNADQADELATRLHTASEPSATDAGRTSTSPLDTTDRKEL